LLQVVISAKSPLGHQRWAVLLNKLHMKVQDVVHPGLDATHKKKKRSGAKRLCQRPERRLGAAAALEQKPCGNPTM